MAVSIAQIEKIKEEFERGLNPKEVAKKYNENPYRISSLARLLGYSFVTSNRNPMDWFIPKDKKPIVLFSIPALKLETKIKKYRVSEIDEKKKTITVKYE